MSPFSDNMEKRIERLYCSYRYFHMRTGVEVRILENASNSVYHATIDGVKPICGVKCELAEARTWRCEEPSKSIMMCERCAWMIRRVRQ